MHRVVILLHTLADGTSHFDWLIDQPNLGVARRLISFRCASRPDFAVSSGFYAQRLPDHRAHYLDYEGVVAPGRGLVERVARGEVCALEMTCGSMLIVIRWADRVVGYRGHLDGAGGGMWHFVPDQGD